MLFAVLTQSPVTDGLFGRRQSQGRTFGAPYFRYCGTKAETESEDHRAGGGRYLQYYE